jgi:hypothetical protein
MWYYVNEFRHNLVDLDPKTYHAFARHLKAVDVTVTITMEVGRSRNCNLSPYLLQSFHKTRSLTILAGDMLHEWCKRVHSRASDQARGHGHFRRFVSAGSTDSECTQIGLTLSLRTWGMSDRKTLAVVRSALKIAKVSRGQPWEQCEVALTHFRKAVGAYDSAWTRGM